MNYSNHILIRRCYPIYLVFSATSAFLCLSHHSTHKLTQTHKRNSVQIDHKPTFTWAGLRGASAIGVQFEYVCVSCVVLLLSTNSISTTTTAMTTSRFRYAFVFAQLLCCWYRVAHRESSSAWTCVARKSVRKCRHSRRRSRERERVHTPAA